MKKALAVVLLVFMVSVGSSASFKVLTNSSKVTADSNLTFRYNTTDQDDYTLSLTNSREELVLSNTQMNLVESYNVTNSENSTNTTNSTGEITTYYIYEYDYQVPHRPEVGDWKIKVFDGFAMLNSSIFTVYPERLRIVEAKILPNFVTEEDSIKFKARITNVTEPVKTVETTVANTSIKNEELTLESTSSFYSIYTLENGALQQGKYNYTVKLEGETGSDASKNSFTVYPGNMDADSSTIEASIASLCGVEVARFRPPGGGVISLNGTGSFLVDIRNNASARTNFTANLTVTYQNNSAWHPREGYDELGPELNMSYRPIESNSSLLPGEVAGPYMRKFNDTDTLGWYTGHLHLSATCQITGGAMKDPQVYGTEHFELTDYANFKVLVGGGGSGDKGNPTGDQAVPRDANTTGAESDQKVKGNNNNPGKTQVPEPEPEPVPEPVPEPTPTVNVNLETWNYSASTDRGRYARIKLEVENIGENPITGLNISPRTGSLPGSWQVRSASVTNLSANSTVNRSVFIQPGEEVTPGTYRIPIYGLTDRVVDLEKVRLKVNKDIFNSSVRIVESPHTIRIGSGESNAIPLLVRNVGKGPVTEADVRVQNVGSCGEVSVSGIKSIKVNESRSIGIRLNASSKLATCNTTVIVSTKDGSYSFSNIKVEVVPERGVVPPKFRFPLFATAWTILLVVYSIVMTRFDLESLTIRIPFVLLIAVEAAIFLYISANYYSIVPGFLLPF